jgi:hypothetical protein
MGFILRSFGAHKDVSRKVPAYMDEVGPISVMGSLQIGPLAHYICVLNMRSACGKPLFLNGLWDLPIKKQNMLRELCSNLGHNLGIILLMF